MGNLDFQGGINKAEEESQKESKEEKEIGPCPLLKYKPPSWNYGLHIGVRKIIIHEG